MAHLESILAFEVFVRKWEDLRDLITMTGVMMTKIAHVSKGLHDSDAAILINWHTTLLCILFIDGADQVGVCAPEAVRAQQRLFTHR